MTFFQMDRAAMRELAEVWDPNVPVTENKPYLERSKRLNKELEVALFSQIARGREAADAAE
jgi:monovalent cation:H+ antiporter-2, CPA2 family